MINTAKNSKYIQYYYEQLVKSTLYLRTGDLEKDIYVSGTETYHFDYLSALRNMLLNQNTNLFFYEEIYIQTYNLIEILRESIHYSNRKYNFLWHQELQKIEELLEKTRMSNKYDFFRLEYEKRNGLESTDESDIFFPNCAYSEEMMKKITFSIIFDELMVFCLNPQVEEKFDIYAGDLVPFIEQFFIWSVNNFYNEKKELFDSKNARENIIKNLKKISWPTIKKLNGENSKYYEEVREQSKILLNKLR